MPRSTPERKLALGIHARYTGHSDTRDRPGLSVGACLVQRAAREDAEKMPDAAQASPYSRLANDLQATPSREHVRRVS